MKVKISRDFLHQLNAQTEFIAQDKPKAARKFKNDFLNRLRKIGAYPFSSRRSIYFDEDQIREVVFKGYKIIYRVDEIKSETEVFGLIRSQEMPKE